MQVVWHSAAINTGLEQELCVLAVGVRDSSFLFTQSSQTRGLRQRTAFMFDRSKNTPNFYQRTVEGGRRPMFVMNDFLVRA